ncbi:hypothetical protein HCU64_06750 [Methylobacterium sp. C25]|uniref:hypothetical protein n=1 Tax=Methylobacterium sp. C25 TaxID=2721622 RepID=UPI001F3D7D24|nr:hypothetical protein [Methylobacterium sp. C25]MCE4223445.1 hypothetical protein [Methylobacterium sp. C25]
MAKAAVYLPKPVEFGRGQNDSVWIQFETAAGQRCSLTWPGDIKEAASFAQAVNAIPGLVDALKAIRADVRDPDTDTAISGASGEKLDDALAAMRVRP